MKTPSAWLKVFITSGAIASILLLATAAGAEVLVESRFGSGDEGWRLVSTLGYDGPVNWEATGGNPGGFIWGRDMDVGAFGFKAPAKFCGNISAAYGGTLSFDVAAYHMPDGTHSWIGLRGTNGLDLIHAYPVPATVYPAWHHRSFTMTETAGWVRVSDGQPPTAAEFTAVLQDLEGFVIAAEFVDGFADDISGLDNVVLTSPGVSAQGGTWSEVKSLFR